MAQEHTQKMIQKSLEWFKKAVKEKNLSDAIKQIELIQLIIQKDIENSAQEGITVNEKMVNFYKDVLENLHGFLKKISRASTT